MSLIDKIKKALEPEPVQEDYFRRNSGKKLMATILEDAPAEAKQKENENTPDTR